MTNDSKKGFTMIEVLLSVATIIIIAGISVPIFQSFQVRNDLDVAAVEVVQTMRRAQVLSSAVDGDTTWGMYIELGSISLFQGSSYLSRDSSFDESFEVPISVTPSGTSEVVFQKFTGLPVSTGTITLTSSTNETRTITINSKGIIEY